MKHFYLIGALLLGLFSSAVVLGQGVTTGSIRGQVVDDQGVSVSGASILAVHTPSGSRYGILTSDDGYFFLANLRVGGPYTVKVSYVGKQTQEVTGLNVGLGQTLRLDFELTNEDLTMDEVEILAEADPILNGDRTGAETQISNTQIRSLPTISRSASDYYRLNPLANGGSFGGRNDQYNNFTLDGSIFNNPFGLDAATPGGQTSAQPVSLDAIDQIQVAVAPYDVRQSGFTGASVNAVTKSGTNEFKGTVFGFFRNQNLTGSKVAGSDIVVPDLSQLQSGFSIGGPLVKNKLFFFANFELERRSDLGSNFVASQPGAEGQNVSRVTAADLNAVSQALFDHYGYETGEYEGYLHQTNNEKAIFKLDWVINDRNSLTMTYNYLNAFQQKNAHPSALGRRGPDAITLQFFNSGYRINNIIHSGIAELKSTFGSKASNKLQVGYSAFRDSRNPFSEPFPVINIQRDGIPYIIAGHEPFSIFNRLNQDVFQITNNFNLYLGAHTFTIGASLERFEFYNSFNLNAYGGTFGAYPSVDSFLNAVGDGSFGTQVTAARELAAANNGEDGIPGEGWALAETNVGQFAFYLQDDWAVTENLKVLFGVRMDMPLFFNTDSLIAENLRRNCCYDPSITYYDEDAEPVQFTHTDLPLQAPLFSPRVGFNYNAGNTQIRGGSGLFAGRFPFVWIGNQVANPNFFFYNMTAQNFRFPQVWRTNLGIDQKFGDGWVLSVDGIYTKDINAMMVRNFGLISPEGTLPGVDGRPIYRNEDRAQVFGSPTNAYVFTNTNVGRSINLSVQLQRYWSENFYTSLSYNFLDARDASSIEAEISSDAYERNPAVGNINEAILTPSLYGARHRIVGAGYKKFTYAEGRMATTISTFFEVAQAGRFSYTYSGDINNDGSGLNDLIYIPTASEMEQLLFNGSEEEVEAQRAAFNAFIDQDAYLSARRGEYVEKYGILSPWYSQIDLRVLQDFNLNPGGKPQVIQLSLDVVNLGNLLNSNWGVRQLPTNTQPIGVGINGQGDPVYSFDPELVNTFVNDFSLLSRWQMQFGLRYIFN